MSPDTVAHALHDAAFTKDPNTGFKGGYRLTDEEHRGWEAACIAVAEHLEKGAISIKRKFDKEEFLSICGVGR